MTAGHVLSDEDFSSVLAGFTQTAFRLELQDAYDEPCERPLFAAFLAGHPFPAPDVPCLHAWYEQVTAQTGAGRTVGRVRVQQDPPTSYQRFERWLEQWNRQAGETIRYLTNDQAHTIGLLPAAGRQDWWLLDSSRLLLMTFDAQGRRIRCELTSDPAAVAQASGWQDLALAHATADQVPHVAA